MRTRRVLLVLPIACLLLAPAGACRARGDPGVSAPDLETRVVLRNAAGKEAHEFGSGEPITIVVTIRNPSGDARTLTLPTSQTHDCFIYRSGASEPARTGEGGGAAGRAEVWRASRGRMFAQVVSELTLKPGESRSFTTTWNQTDGEGRPVPPGVYRAVGLVPGGDPGCRSDAVPFTIRPPAAP
jgi:hypothetical protein